MNFKKKYLSLLLYLILPISLSEIIHAQIQVISLWPDVAPDSGCFSDISKISRALGMYKQKKNLN